MQRLRRWLLVSVIVFAALLATLIGYTRYRALRARLNLPRQLGFDIKSQADSFTISRSGVDGRPLFTIHASKAIQHKNGITTLRDVNVTLYGPPGSNRTDSIRGAEFEYDQANGVVRAMGDTLLDVGVAEGSNAPANAKRLTMQGKGLVFLQKLGIASTKEQIRFQYGDSQGEAIGADYDMDTGLLTLQHDVHLHSTENGHPERIDAASAQLDRNTRIATLQDATLTDAGDSMQAPHMVASLRSAPDEHAGTLQKLDASGGVILHTAAGQRVQAPELHADVTPQNRLAQVTMQSGVHLQDDRTEAFSQRALLRFNNGHADHLMMTGQTRVRQSAGAGISRTLDAAEVESSLQDVGGSHLSLGELHATGMAKLVMLQPAKQAGRVERTELASPALIAHSVPGSRTGPLRDLQANGRARLTEDDGAGTIQTSTSDNLTAAFAVTGDPMQPSSSLDSVVQQGHVTIHEIHPATTASPITSARSASQADAAADHAEFRAANNLLVLTGAPHVSGDGLQLSATQISLHRDSGDAEATGTVRGSIAQTSNAAPTTKNRSTNATQFAGDFVRLTHSTGAVLLQGGSTDARLWTATGQVEAPAIEADQKASTLHAFGTGVTTGGATVKTVLIQPPSGAGVAASGGSTDARSPTRVFSRDLFYHGSSAGKPGTADFRGGVRLLQGDDVITSDSATAILQPAAATQSGPAAQAVPMLASDLQSITAEGHVRVQQGDRTATGTHLLYTASSRNAVLTGTPGAPPVVHDPMQGTLTGTQLTLHMGQGKGDNQVQVSGAPAAPVHTELDVPDKRSGPGSQARSSAGRKSHPTP